MKFFKKHLHLVVIACVLLSLTIGLAIWIFAGDDQITYKRVTTGYISPSDIAIDGTNAYVSDATSNKVYKLNLSNGSVVATYAGSQAVNSVEVVNGSVYALEGGLAGNVIKLSGDLSGADQTVETGHTPVDMVAVNGKLYVACRYTNNVYVYNESDLSLVTTIATSREPMALTVAGSNVYVACHLTADSADNSINEIVTAKVVVIDTNTDTASKEISLLNGSDGVKDICTSSDGSYVYVSHVLARYAYPTTQLDRGWINTNAITIIDTASQEVFTAVLLDNVELGAANPWGVECDGTNLVVSIAGTSEMIVIDTTKMFSAIDRVQNGGNEYVETIEDIPNYMPFLDSCKTRVTLEGEGLRRFAISDGKAYVCEYFTGDIAVFDIDSKTVSSNISLGEQPEMDDNRYGEIIWNDGNLCYQQWESCASCHPDGRVDGLNWDNLNDGLGNPKNVKSMLYAHRTPPVMITGIRADAETAVRAGMKYIQFNVLDDDSLNALDEYIKSIAPIDSPYLNRDGTYTEEALEGEKLFASEGCVTCHYGPNFTDMLLHTSASDHTYNANWESRDFDTPTLVEVWSTGPWFASGQYKTLREAVVASLKDASKLSDEQIDNLTTYVGSIGKVGQYYGVEQVHMTKADGTNTYNSLHADGTIYKMTVKKQLETDKNATVTIKLYSADKKEVSSKSFNLESMAVGDTAIITFEMSVGSDLGNGSYYVVSIADTDGNSLATDFTVYNND